MSYLTIKILVALFFWYITIPLLIIGLIFHLFGISIGIFEILGNERRTKKIEEKRKQIEHNLDELLCAFKQNHKDIKLQHEIISVLSQKCDEDNLIQTNIKGFASNIYYLVFLLVCKNPYDSQLSKFLIDTEYYYCKLINGENSLVQRRDTSTIRKFLIKLREKDPLIYNFLIEQLEEVAPTFIVHEHIYIMLEKFLAIQHTSKSAFWIYHKISEWICVTSQISLKEKVLSRFEEIPDILKKIEEMKFYIELLKDNGEMDRVFQFSETLSEHVRYRGDNHVEEVLFSYKQEFITNLIFILFDLIEENSRDNQLHRHLIDLLPKTYHMDTKDIYQKSLDVYASSSFQNELKVLVLEIGRCHFARKRWFKKLKPEDEQTIQNDILMRTKI